MGEEGSRLWKGSWREDEVGAAFGLEGALKWRLRRHRAQASIWSYCWKDIKMCQK
jgi:hypothetical protein